MKNISHTMRELSAEEASQVGGGLFDFDPIMPMLDMLDIKLPLTPELTRRINEYLLRGLDLRDKATRDAILQSS